MLFTMQYIFGRLALDRGLALASEKGFIDDDVLSSSSTQLNDYSNNYAFTMRPSQIMRSGGGDAPLGMYGK
jgi:hypothetical protein